MLQSDPPKMTDADFDLLSKLVKAELGLNLRPEKKTLVESRLNKRLKQLSLESFTEYTKILKSKNRREFHELSQSLTTNVTSFFREIHHFRLLEETARNSWRDRINAGEEIRIWSAGCSNGSEPYSIAITLAEALLPSQLRQIKILATDIDESILSIAREGRYGEREAEGLSDSQRDKYFAQKGSDWQVKKSVRDMIQFKPLNLIKPWPFKKQFHMIFCRNVAIYFDMPTQAALWNGFLDQIAPDGMLAIGHSERLDAKALSRVRSTGVTAYQKL